MIASALGTLIIILISFVVKNTARRYPCDSWIVFPPHFVVLPLFFASTFVVQKTEGELIAILETEEMLDGEININKA